MTPFSFEWQWNVEYLIFMGLLYTALTIIGCGLAYCLVKSWLEHTRAEEVFDSHPELSYRSRYSEY